MIVLRRFLQLLDFIAVLFLLIQGHVLCDGGSNARCIDNEAHALLKFKEGLSDPSNPLSSWTTGKDCCQWKGVGCNRTTGRVISLDLHCANSSDKLQGRELSSSLLQLPYLSSLNLSGNDFMQSQVPSFLGTMKSLKHLDLSNANFKGPLPESLGNLSRLESLDLSRNDFSLEVNNLEWLHVLSSLKNLDLSGVDLSSSANDWFRDISMLPSLVTLRLSGCQLRNLPQSPPQVIFHSLVTLDLSFNYFNNTIPDWLFEKCHDLQHLNLGNNQLQGPIPDFIERLNSLVSLDLSHNEFIGSIPTTLGQAHGQNRVGANPRLKELHLSNNQLNGSLERSLGQLSKLTVLDLAGNNLEGKITDAHLANFKSLRVLDLSFNRVILNLSKNWVPPFNLETIGLGNCQLGPQFPKWIQTQKNFSYIDISNASISDTVPDWFWDLSPSIEYMNLSFNQLRRCGHDFSSKFKLHTLDLSYNNFSCPLPHFPPNMITLDLAANSFYGTISHVCEMLGVNNSLSFLDLSSNDLSGVIPNCWQYGKHMIILDLANNHLFGSIPDSLGNLTSLHTLSIYSNNLSGRIPDTLENCEVLIVLNLWSNRIWGAVPSWIGQKMQILRVLMLGRNSFEGNIPTTLCQLESLHLLDLSENQLTGPIPRCVFAAMVTPDTDRSYIYDPYTTYVEHLYLTFKGFYLYHSRNMLRALTVMDLSSNFLTEGIPVEITMLVELVALNLSRNQLVGSIPSDIGELKNLESLDLSRNQLSCAIPTSMASIYSLMILDLSYNTLSGKIPSGPQMEDFDVFSYEGNPHLCGPPLTEACDRKNSFQDIKHCSASEGNREHENDGNHEDNNSVVLGISPFYISMGIGYITAFWVFLGCLTFITSWRYAYFRFLDNMNDRIYVTIAVSLAKLRRKFQGQQVSQYPN
ncbi:receptor-like protein EIX1 [Gastrolobium bilobum]|uniref:receptor-like protein EIX1 n=1 Tax=Gastrolobium bilobum TaxID=150636 RepID=UPI002AB0C077|nr:receptor-like protein EIX1 [Gastrolobium bilobum]